MKKVWKVFGVMKSKAAQALTNFPAESQSTVPLWDVLCLRLTSQRHTMVKHILSLQGIAQGFTSGSSAAELHPGPHY